MKPGDIERIKALLPTTLGSEELRESVASDILRRSVFSARMASASYLARLRDICGQISDGSINQASAVADLLGVLGQMGHTPQDDGGMSNPASIRRLNLIVDTQRQMAASASRVMGQTEATLYAHPGWELTRLETRAVPRVDWGRRWREAGQAVNWDGASERKMVALKTSPIWQALGDGAGGFRDTLRNPFPPFAYGSGLAWVAVDREECKRLGLIDDGEKPKDLPKPKLSPGAQDIADAIARYGLPEIGEGIA